MKTLALTVSTVFEANNRGENVDEAEISRPRRGQGSKKLPRDVQRQRNCL